MVPRFRILILPELNRKSRHLIYIKAYYKLNLSYMKRLFKIFALCAAIVMSAMHFTSCESELLDSFKIVGKWQVVKIETDGLLLDEEDLGSGIFYYFESDGTFRIDSTEPKSGTWVYQNKTLVLTAGEETITYAVENFTLLTMTLVSNSELLGKPVQVKTDLVKIVN